MYRREVPLIHSSDSHQFEEEYEQIGTAAGDELASRFDPELGGRRLTNYLRAMVLGTQTLARQRQWVTARAVASASA